MTLSTKQNSEKNTRAPKEGSCSSEDHPSDLNAGTADPSDGREQHEWETSYPRKAVIEIRYELIFLFILLFTSLFLIFFNWVGWINTFIPLSPEQNITLRKYLYFAFSGLLGGVAYGIKYFYRTVARGYWHQDRRIWRVMSPFVALIIGLIVGTMINSNIMKAPAPLSGAACVSIGFVSGYFADQAVGKMYEIAAVIFGKSAVPHD